MTAPTPAVPLSKPATVLLARDTPVTAVLRPYAEGTTDWPATLAKLGAVEFAAVDRSAPDPLGQTPEGVERYHDLTVPDVMPPEGSWDEVVAARDFGILTAGQLAEALEQPQTGAPAA